MSAIQDRDQVLDQMVAITAADGTIGRRSCEELLRASDWNLERAINAHYTSGPPPPSRGREPSPVRSSPLPRRRSASSSYPPNTPEARANQNNTPLIARVGLGTVYGLFWPIRFVLRILIGFWYTLAKTVIPAPLLALLPRLLLPPASQARLPPPGALAKPFLRSLREDYSPSLITDSDRLPDFYGGRYKEFLRMIRQDAKLGVVVLCCGEHEDDEAFKREVLLNEEFGRVLREKDVAIWGGDVREREAYQVAQTLQITTYPSLTFFSLLPPSSSSGSSSSTANAKLTILTTISGSPSTTTSLASILHLLHSTLIPRSQSFLARVKRERRALEESRRVREDQDRRAEESARVDRERIMASRREREERERTTREAEEKARTEERERQRKEEIRRKQKDDRIVWRRYLRRSFAQQAQVSMDQVKAGKAVRVQIKLPMNGGNRSAAGGTNRNIRVFAKDDQGGTGELFRWAESLLVPSGPSYPAEEDPTTPPADLKDPYESHSPTSADPVGPRLRLFTSYPRKEVGLEPSAWDVVVQAGGSLVMEVEKEDRGGESDAESGSGSDTDEDD